MTASRVFLYSHNGGSRGAASLSQSMDGMKRIRTKNSKFKGNNRKTVVNWGFSGELPEEVQKCQIINQPAAIRNASNKRRFFEAVAATPEGRRPNIPPFTVDREVARGWLTQERPRTIFARTVLNGSSGEGIVKINTQEELNAIPNGTLLVQYIPKRREFRLHVSRDNGVFSVQEKLRRTSTPDDQVDYQIRSHDNGFVFARDQVELPDGVEEQAIRALAVTDLDFGAVDIIYNERQAAAYVLEINTAPGLEGATVDHYSEEIGRILQRNEGGGTLVG